MAFAEMMSEHHDDVIKWKHFPRCWLFVRGIHRSPVNSLHKGQWRRALTFLWSAPEWTVEYTIVGLVIWDAIAPIMRSLWCTMRLVGARGMLIWRFKVEIDVQSRQWHLERSQNDAREPLSSLCICMYQYYFLNFHMILQRIYSLYMQLLCLLRNETIKLMFPNKLSMKTMIILPWLVYEFPHITNWWLKFRQESVLCFIYASFIADSTVHHTLQQ